jgi:hypothetical protein
VHIEMAKLVRDPLSEKRKKSESLVDTTNQSLLRANGGVKRAIIYADPPWKYTIEHHEKGTP